jgi:hypothetical protein
LWGKVIKVETLNPANQYSVSFDTSIGYAKVITCHKPRILNGLFAYECLMNFTTFVTTLCYRSMGVWGAGIPITNLFWAVFQTTLKMACAQKCMV